MYFVGRRLLPEGGDVPEKFLSELDPMQHNVPKQVIAGLILVGCMVVMCLDLEKITIEMAAVIGALVCVLTGCLSEKQAYHSIEWSTIFLFAGMMPVSHAAGVPFYRVEHHLSVCGYDARFARVV